MTTQPDFEELLRLLEKNSVHYMIVGGYAVAFHKYPRFTKDMDIFFEKSKSNILLLRKTLVEFGFSEDELSDSIFEDEESMIQFGVPPTRIDLIGDISGVPFIEAEENLVRGRYGNVEVNFIGKADLIRNKRASGRSQDKVDADNLE
jgi:hypothetical protein